MVVVECWLLNLKNNINKEKGEDTEDTLKTLNSFVCLNSLSQGWFFIQGLLIFFFLTSFKSLLP